MNIHKPYVECFVFVQLWHDWLLNWYWYISFPSPSLSFWTKYKEIMLSKVSDLSSQWICCCCCRWPWQYVTSTLATCLSVGAIIFSVATRNTKLIIRYTNERNNNLFSLVLWFEALLQELCHKYVDINVDLKQKQIHKALLLSALPTSTYCYQKPFHPSSSQLPLSHLKTFCWVRPS